MPIQETILKDTLPISRQNFLQHHDTHPLLFDILLLQVFGVSWLSWEAETLVSELKRVFGTNPSNLNWQIIQAVKTCHLTTSPWEAWEVFALVCQALNNNIPNFQSLQKPSPAQTILAADLMNRIDSNKFSEEVAKFVAAAFLDDGIYYLPDPVSFAQEWASRTYYKCVECGNIDKDYENSQCDSCGASQDKLKLTDEYNWKRVESKYQETIKKRAQNFEYDELKENEVDIQIAKLLVAHDYKIFRNEQLKSQLGIFDELRT